MPDLSDPLLYINRELNWIEFDRKVLEEACDLSVPLLEQLKFLAISTTILRILHGRVAQHYSSVQDGSGVDFG